MKQGPKRILIFNVNWLGDVLFSTATVRNIRRNFPDSFIACVIPSRCYPVLKDNPHLDEIIIFDERDRHRGMLEKWKFIQHLKSKKFDQVFLLHRSFSRTLICRLADISERIGYHTKKRSFLMSSRIMPPPRDSLHRVDYYLNIIEKAGLKVEDRFLEFYFSQSDGDFVNDFLKKNAISDNDFLAVLNPGGNWKPKRWPFAYWAELSDRLIEELGAKVVITGSHADIALAKQIKEEMKSKPIIAAGIFNLKQLGALARRAGLFISADTGPLHIASAVGARSIIAIFGPTSVAITGPYPSANTVILRKDVGCKIPCYVLNCKDNRCMKAVTPSEVMEEAKRIRSADNRKPITEHR